MGVAVQAKDQANLIQSRDDNVDKVRSGHLRNIKMIRYRSSGGGGGQG